MIQNLTIDWHRAFGIAIKRLISEHGYSVHMEMEVSQQKQLLDLIIIRQEQVKPIQTEQLCDGFDNLAKYNLISYKSLHESFNDFAVEELYGYYISYRKLTEQKARKLPKTDYRLYGIATKKPEKLLRTVRHKQIQPGVYDLLTGLKPIRLVVLNTLEQKQSNAILNLFSDRREQFTYGYRHIDQQKFNTRDTPVVNKIIELYKLEGVTMPYTEEQFLEDYKRSLFNRMTPQERIKGLKPEEILGSFKREEILGNFKPQERLEGLRPQERLEGLKLDELREIKKYLYDLDK